MMKRKWIMGLLISMALLAVGGCGKKQEEKKETVKEETGKENSQANTKEPLAVAEYNVDDYIETLADYKGVEYTQVDTEASDEEVQEELNQLLKKHPEIIKDKDKVIAKGDVVNIDFEGKKDGVAFDGGTSKGFSLGIGSGTFIPGFEDGLVGHKMGETLDLNLKFPDDYHAEELKGAAVVFTVTINHFEVPAKELTDEMVSKDTEFKTVQEYTESIKKKISEFKKNNAAIGAQMEILNKVIENSKIKEVPETLMNFYTNSFKGFYEERAKQAKVSLEDYVKNIMKSDMKKFEEEAKEYAKTMSHQRMILEAIAKKEGKEIDEESYKIGLEKYYKESGYAGQMDQAKFEELVGKENIKNAILGKEILNFIYENGSPKK